MILKPIETDAQRSALTKRVKQKGPDVENRVVRQLSNISVSDR